jgi:hypothetical protein
MVLVLPVIPLVEIIVLQGLQLATPYSSMDHALQAILRVETIAWENEYY